MQVNLATKLLRANQEVATENRHRLQKSGVVALNLISSPGAGKTTLLERTVEALKDRVPLAVIEGDQYTALDAERIERLGVPVVQVNMPGGCHLDAGMVASALDSLDLERFRLLLIENVGNLICPAEFDLGEAFKVGVLSVTEGNDKPKKYPVIFQDAQAAIINKIDLLPYVDFDLGQAVRDLQEINPGLKVIPASATRCDGLEEWFNWLRETAACPGC